MKTEDNRLDEIQESFVMADEDGDGQIDLKSFEA